MAIGGGHRAPSRVANVKNTVQPVQPSLDLEANRHEAIFLFHSSTTVSSTCSYRIRSSYTSKCPVRPVFPCPNHVSLHHPRCASSREQFRTVSPLSRDPSFDRVEQGQRVPAIRFSFPQNGKESEEEEKKKKIKVAQPLCYRWSSPKRTTLDRGVVTVPLVVVPFSHTSSTGWIFCLLYGRNWLSPPSIIIPLRALLSRNRISTDGQRPEPEGLDLRNFLKSDSGDAVGTCELGTELERVGKRFQSLIEEDEGLRR